MDSKECKKYLAAFADGELDVDQNLRLLERMKMDPNATARVTHQQQLRDAVCRCMTGDCPDLPDSLKQSVTQILEEPSVDQQANVIARIGTYQFTTWLSSAAAIIAIGLSLWMYFNPSNAIPSSFAASPLANAQHLPGFHDYTAASLLPVSQIKRFSKRHLSCSKQVSLLHGFASNPSNKIEEMPNVVTQHLGMQSYPCLDLTAIGYEFAGAGPCVIPGNKAAHLIYKSKAGTGLNHTISLWITPDDGTLDLVPDTVFRVRGPESPNSIITWRHNNLIYYIVGESYPDVQKAYLALETTEQTGA